MTYPGLPSCQSKVWTIEPGGLGWNPGFTPYKLPASKGGCEERCVLTVVFVVVISTVRTLGGSLAHPDPGGLFTLLDPFLSFESLPLKYRHTTQGNPGRLKSAVTPE